MTDINKPTPEIEAQIARWQRNRDIIAGEDAVKAKRAQYYARPILMDGEAAFTAYLKRMPFFPAASRVLEGLMGLVFRKPITLKTSTALTPIMETITSKGWTVSDLCEEVVREVFTTGYVGLLVDHPEAPSGLSEAEVQKRNLRPFIRNYRAEAILEITPGVSSRNTTVLTRVRVYDNPTSIREMVLIDGVYTVIIHREVEGPWIADAPITPKKGGVTLDEIPFYVASTKARAMEPVKAVMDDVCSLNVQLCQANANSANSLFYVAHPKPYIIGAPEADLKVGADAVLFFPDGGTPDKKVELGMLEFGGAGQKALSDDVQRIKDEISAIGSRIIAPDTKAAVETAEALTLRKANENSVLAANVRTITRPIKEASNKVAWWMNQPEVEFSISTDFLPTPMTPQERAQVIAEWQAGFITHETGLKLYIDGEIFDSEFDVEGEIEKVNVESAAVDRPLNTKTLTATDPAAPTTDEEPTGNDGE